MSDDQRERHPLRDQADNPPEDGLRSDHAGTGGGVQATVGARPSEQTSSGGADKAPADPGDDPARSEALTGQFTGAGGGYGTRSGTGSSGGSEGRAENDDTPTGDDTEWLRDAPGAGESRQG